MFQTVCLRDLKKIDQLFFGGLSYGIIEHIGALMTKIYFSLVLLNCLFLFGMPNEEKYVHL